MSTMIIEPITTSDLEQDFRLKLNTSLNCLRLHLMKYGTPSGNLVIEILSGATVIKTITTAYSTLNAEFTKSYGHGVFKFDLDLPLIKNGTYTEYTLRLSASSYDASNYYAWVKDWIPEKNNLYGEGNITDGVTPQDTLKPYHFELYEYN